MHTQSLRTLIKSLDLVNEILKTNEVLIYFFFSLSLFFLIILTFLFYCLKRVPSIKHTDA